MAFQISIFYVIFMPVYILSYSFDVDFPIVYHDPFATDNESPTQFGLSVILHPGNLSTAWIQIGAPKANNSFRNVNQPGMGLKCNILGNCKNVSFDDGFTKFSMSNNKYHTKKLDKALLSSTMDIQHSRIVACAPKWVVDPAKNKKYDLVEGACYWTTNASNSYKMIFPLEGEPVYKNRENKETRYADFGMAGFSLHMITEKEFIVGAPGFANFRGTIVRLKDSSNSKNNEFADIKLVNPYKVSDISSFSYNGYAVSSGQYFGKYGLQYAASAPKKSYTGEVNIFNLNPKKHSGILHSNTVKGTQLGEYFGCSLTSGDINGDGFDDLVVGAPFHKGDKYNEGSVYVYFGKHNPPFATPSKGAVLRGKVMGAQFGQSIMFLGDIDYDGYSDIAVGAPFENESTGVVYIFLGLSDGVNPEPAQKLLGKSVDLNIRGFGYSISRPVDVDRNEYHDVAIGAFSSGHAVLFRNRKSVTLHQEITNVQNVNLTLRFNDFPIQVCIWYTSQYPPQSIYVQRKITVDPNYQRGILVESNKILVNTSLIFGERLCENVSITSTSAMNTNNAPFTITVTQKLIITKSPKTIINIFDKPIDETADRFNKELPVLSKQKQQNEATHTMYYTTGCKNENVCKTNLIITAGFDLKGKKEFIIGSANNLKLFVSIKNTGEKAYASKLSLILPPHIYLRNTKPNCHNILEHIIECTVDNPIDEGTNKTLYFDLDVSEIQRYASFKQVMFNASMFTSSLNLNSNFKLFALLLKEEADIELTGSSEQEFSVNETAKEIKFSTRFKVQKHGLSPLSSVQLNIDLPISLKLPNGTIHKVMKVFPPDTSNNKQSVRCFPVNFLYYDENELVDNLHVEEESSLLQPNNNDDDNDDVTTTPRMLLKRNVYDNEDVEVITELVDGKSAEYIAKDKEESIKLPFYLNCTNPLVQCSQVVCNIAPLVGVGELSTAIVTLKAKLDTQVLSKHLDKHNIILLAEFGKVTIKEPKNFKENGDKSNTVDVSVKFINDKKQKIELWILIAAVLAGLLLLALSIFGLVMAGFFRRTDKLKLQALKEAEQLLTSEMVKEHMPLKTEPDDEDDKDNKSV